MRTCNAVHHVSSSPGPDERWHAINRPHRTAHAHCASLARASRQDTEFPGVVARPIGSFKSSSDFHYQTLRCNVDLLKIIQIGLTLCNEEGQLAPGVCTFQFNFKFSLR